MKAKKIILSTLAMLTISSFANDMQLNMSQKRGLYIQTPYGDLSACSRIIFIEPPWNSKWFFNQTSEAEFISTSEDGVQTVAMNHTSDDVMKIIEYKAVEQDNKITITLKGELTQDVSCMVEHTSFILPSLLFEGAKFTATLADGEVVTGELTVGDRGNTCYIVDASRIELVSNYGQLNLQVNKGLNLCVDGRRDTVFEGVDCYWVGNLGSSFSYGELYDSEIELEFIPNPEIKMPYPIVQELANEPVKVVEQSNIRREEAEFELPVMPTIKEQTMLSQAALTLGKTPNIELNFTGDEVEVDRLNRAINRLYNRLETNDSGSTNIQAMVGESFLGLESPTHPDGYAMQVDESGIKLVSLTPRGIYYGMQTLRSLAQNGGVPAQNIIDYPTLDFRGVHLLADDGSLALHGKMAEDLFGRYKLNNIIFEIEYVAWDATKELHHPNAMTKAELKALLEICKDNYIDVSPLFQTLGHCGWLFINGNNIHLAEDPDYPYAYNVSHPEVYPLMEKIMAEIIETFDNPKYMHIGHDEVDMVARYPYQPENVARGIADLVISDIMFYHDYLSKHGIQVMMWHDMIMYRTESSHATGMQIPDVKKYRDMLPRDIIIANWNYSGGESVGDFPCMQLLTDEGFTALGCTWFETNNIENMTTATAKAKAGGFLGTTWTGYFGSNTSLANNFHQIATYLRGASWAWNTSHEANKERGDFLKEFSVLAHQMWPTEKEEFATNGKTLKLDSVMNAEISADSNIFLNYSDYGINQLLKAGELNFIGDMAFDIVDLNGHVGALALYSDINCHFPESVTIAVDNLQCKTLNFLHTNLTDSRSFGKTTAKCLVTYGDGSTAEIPMVYGKMIGNIFDAVYSYTMTPAKGIEVDIDGEKRFLVYGTWENPNPEKEIVSLTFSLGYPIRSYYLFGITAQ